MCDGAGICVECLATADCGDTSTTCATRKCRASHTCVMSNAGFGVACADHGGAVCDGKGACVACNTAADCDSGTACKIMPSCSSRACKYSNASAGTSCSDGNGHLCNDSGECVGVAAITAGGNHTCVVTTLGAAKCWGSNSKGQLGNNLLMDQVAPTDVLGLESGVRSMSNSDQTSCALVTGGGVKCWGWNADGEVGDGTTTDRPTPVDVPGLSNVKSLASSAIGAHMCAVTAAGGLKCWGNNSFGQLGDGTTASQNAPVDVPALASGVTSVATGLVHTCAIKTSGELLCWGLNSNGQLGDGTTTNQSAPVDVAWSHSASGGCRRPALHVRADDGRCAILLGRQLRRRARRRQHVRGAQSPPHYGPRERPGDRHGRAARVRAHAGGRREVLGRRRGRTARRRQAGQLSVGTRRCRRAVEWRREPRRRRCLYVCPHGCRRREVLGPKQLRQLGDGTKTERDVPVDVLGL